MIEVIKNGTNSKITNLKAIVAYYRSQRIYGDSNSYYPHNFFDLFNRFVGTTMKANLFVQFQFKIGFTRNEATVRCKNLKFFVYLYK